MNTVTIYENPVTRREIEGIAHFRSWSGPVDAAGYRRALVLFCGAEFGEPAVDRLLDPATVRQLAGEPEARDDDRHHYEPHFDEKPRPMSSDPPRVLCGMSRKGWPHYPGD